jgi:hypothetical protein
MRCTHAASQTHTFARWKSSAFGSVDHLRDRVHAVANRRHRLRLLGHVAFGSGRSAKASAERSHRRRAISYVSSRKRIDAVCCLATRAGNVGAQAMIVEGRPQLPALSAEDKPMPLGWRRRALHARSELRAGLSTARRRTDNLQIRPPATWMSVVKRCAISPPAKSISMNR